ncbi:MAG TPA: MFS transporter [Bryobacteraceae bacterium]|nr:MFS transporter [Bryobacteraceae bacterium]
MSATTIPATPVTAREQTAYPILGTISFCHFLNDLIQSLLPAIYPLLKNTFHLDFSQIGLITFTTQFVASVLQPVVGTFTDRRPQPYSLPIGMGFTLSGLLLLSAAWSFPTILLAVALVGVGSSVFHPESARVARMAAGPKPGFAQAIFQVGGNFGTASGPLLAAFIVTQRGQGSVAWFSIAALIAIVFMMRISKWAIHYRLMKAKSPAVRVEREGHGLSPKKVALAIAVLVMLMFSKFIYLASLTSYYTFFLISKFHVSVKTSELYLFVFLGAVAAGTLLGGPFGDRVGRKYVIWFSILGALPFTLALPYVSLFWTGVFSALIGLILGSAFPAIVVFAQELLPGKIGMISGLFFGLAFGTGGIAAALLGALADHTSISFVYSVCSFLPMLGLLTAFLPNVAEARRQQARTA